MFIFQELTSGGEGEYGKYSHKNRAAEVDIVISEPGLRYAS